MVSQLLVTISLACSSPQLDGTVLNTMHGKVATSQFQALSPADSTNWYTLGVLYANRIFTMESKNKRRDADSALHFLRKARTLCPENPVIAAYIAVTIGLRVKEDNIFKQKFGDSRARANETFRVMDSLQRAYPKNLAVQFLSACLFREASKYIKNQATFLLTSYDTFHSLHKMALSGQHQEFFSPDVRGHILLSLAILIGKLENHAEADATAQEYIAALFREWPNTPAAKYAQEKKMQEK